MIEIHVSVALNLLDGFTGRPLKPAQVRVFLDGEPVRAVYKEGGWFVLVNLAPGMHALRVEGEGFQPEERTVQGGAACEEIVLRLLPAPSYRFGRRVTTLTVRLPEGQREAGVYALGGERYALRLAQDDAAPGDRKLRLFSSEKAALLPVPGLFYLEDGDQGELVSLRAAEGMNFSLETPLQRAHRRGCLLRPASACRANAAGEIFLAVEEGETIGLLVEKDGVLHHKEVPLHPQEHNEYSLTFD